MCGHDEATAQHVARNGLRDPGCRGTLFDGVVNPEARHGVWFVPAPFAEEQRTLAPTSQILAQRGSGFGVQVDRPGPAVTDSEPHAWRPAAHVRCVGADDFAELES